jgi:hypothetical protein
VTTANGLLLLLRSRNVAPRAIAQLLPSLQDSFRSLSPQFELLCHTLAGRSLFDDRPPTVNAQAVPASMLGLGPLLERQVENFNSAIQESAQATLNAKARLTLEQSVLGISHHLAALLAMFELWSDTLRPRAVVDLVELLTLSRFGDQPPIPHRQVLHLKLVPSPTACMLHAPPRAILNWLGLAAAVLANPSPPPNLGIRLVVDGPRSGLVFGPVPEASPHFLPLQLPALVPETEPNLLDVVRRLGVSGQRTEAGLAFEWVPGELVMTGVAN